MRGETAKIEGAHSRADFWAITYQGKRHEKDWQIRDPSRAWTRRDGCGV
jgi:hypothetical protein